MPFARNVSALPVWEPPGIGGSSKRVRGVAVSVVGLFEPMV
jgi:hypothetical protein